MAKIVVVGSANADLVARVPRFPAPGETLSGTDFRIIPGGKGANQAVAARRVAWAGNSMNSSVTDHPDPCSGQLWDGVTFVGCVGEDANGDFLLASLREAGVVCQVRRDAQATGVAMILVDDAGQNEIVVIPGANGRLAAPGLDPWVSQADIVLFQLETPTETVAAGLRQATGTTILNPAPAHDLPDDFPWERVGVLTPNETETEALCGILPTDETTCRHAAEALLDRGVGTVVITLGAHGSYFQSAEDRGLIASFKVAAVDTTAAGDAFNGGLAVALSEAKSLRDALRWANAVGALSATKPGAQPSMPSRSEVEAMIGG
ncbi:MAG: ribokinase [Fimbriimonadaceae bacterium]|nr:ribokinase [Fimbriimonadaceae bacterium]